MDEVCLGVEERERAVDLQDTLLDLFEGTNKTLRQDEQASSRVDASLTSTSSRSRPSKTPVPPER